MGLLLHTSTHKTGPHPSRQPDRRATHIIRLVAVPAVSTEDVADAFLLPLLPIRHDWHRMKGEGHWRMSALSSTRLPDLPSMMHEGLTPSLRHASGRGQGLRRLNLQRCHTALLKPQTTCPPLAQTREAGEHHPIAAPEADSLGDIRLSEVCRPSTTMAVSSSRFSFCVARSVG